jgi:hypothetical protein
MMMMMTMMMMMMMMTRALVTDFGGFVIRVFVKFSGGVRICWSRLSEVGGSLYMLVTTFGRSTYSEICDQHLGHVFWCSTYFAKSDVGQKSLSRAPAEYVYVGHNFLAVAASRITEKLHDLTEIVSNFLAKHGFPLLPAIAVRFASGVTTSLYEDD